MVTKIIREVKTVQANYLCKCECCGREFESLRKDAKYCSPLCRVTACNERKKRTQKTHTASKTTNSAPKPSRTQEMQPKVSSGEGITYFQTKNEMLDAFAKRIPGFKRSEVRNHHDFIKVTGYDYKTHPNQTKIPKFEVFKVTQ